MVLTYDARAGLSASSSATDVLVQEHAPLVKRIALHLLARLPDSVLLDDLMQAGMIGLLEAARSFDPTQGASFSTFAGIRIRGAIIDEIRRGDWAPRSVHKAGREIARTIADLESRLGREVADGEVADTRLFSLETLELDEGRSVAADQDRTLAGAEQSQLLEKVGQAIGDLPEREQLVLNLYYTELLNLKEIGAVLEVSESRVSQIMSQATLRLRARLSTAGEG